VTALGNVADVFAAQHHVAIDLEPGSVRDLVHAVRVDAPAARPANESGNALRGIA
jgi:hypothetical protein